MYIYKNKRKGTFQGELGPPSSPSTPPLLPLLRVCACVLSVTSYRTQP